MVSEGVSRETEQERERKEQGGVQEHDWFCGGISGVI